MFRELFHRALELVMLFGTRFWDYLKGHLRGIEPGLRMDALGIAVAGFGAALIWAENVAFEAAFLLPDFCLGFMISTLDLLLNPQIDQALSMLGTAMFFFGALVFVRERMFTIWRAFGLFKSAVLNGAKKVLNWHASSH